MTNFDYSVFADMITVSRGPDNLPRYNGYDSIYEALTKLGPEIEEISFAKRCLLSAEVLNVLNMTFEPPAEEVANAEPPSFDGRLFVYTWEALPEPINEILITVQDLDDGVKIVNEYLSNMKTIGAMKNESDLKGLHLYLIESGELLINDELMMTNDTYLRDSIDKGGLES